MGHTCVTAKVSEAQLSGWATPGTQATLHCVASVLGGVVRNALLVDPVADLTQAKVLRHDISIESQLPRNVFAPVIL